MVAAGLSLSISPAAAAPTTLKIAATNAVNDGGIGTVGPISCAGGVCVAGGAQEVNGQNPGGTLTMTAPTGALNFSASNGNVVGISCVSSTTCIGVGQQYVQVGQTQMFTIVNGAVATATTSTDPFLRSVACVSSTLCYAVGQQSGSENSEVVPLTVGTGGVSAGAGSAAGMSILDIVCPTSTTCYGAGDESTSAAVVTITNGVPGTPVTVAGAEQLQGIACSSATTCVAVGETSTGAGAEVLVTSGTPGTEVTDTNASLFTAVACPTSDCIAVGEASPSFTGSTTSEGYLATTQSQQDLATTSVTIFGNIACSGITADVATCYGTGPTSSPGTNAILTINDGAQLSVSSVFPTNGPIAGGVPLTVTGNAFTGATSVSFLVNGTSVATASPTNVTDGSLTVTAPNLTASVVGNSGPVTVDVEVTTPSGTSAVNAPDDQYSGNLPLVTAVNTQNGTNSFTGPAAGPVKGNETIQLTGQYLTGVTDVSFQPTQDVAFASAVPSSINAAGTQLTLTAPDASTEYTATGVTGDLFTDLIAAVPVSGAALSSVTSSPTASGANDKFYLVPVAVTDVEPHTAAVVGGTPINTIVVSGTGLSNGTVELTPVSGSPAGKGCGSGVTLAVPPNAGATATTLSFTAPNQADAMLATGGDVVCDVEVQVPVPELGTGITLTSAANPGAPGDTLTYPFPVVQSVGPVQSGPLGGGTPLIITGVGLIGVSEVEFTIAGGFVAPSPSTSVSPPSVSPNAVSVTTPSGTLLLVSGAPTLRTDVKVEIPTTFLNTFITSAVNSPADNFTFTQANACASLSACTTGTSTGAAPAVATSTGPNGSITVTGTGGAGSVTVGRYSANPVGATSFSTGGSFFDASMASGSAFTSATLQDCDLGGGTTLQWFNSAANGGVGAWQAVTPLTGPTDTTPPCVTATFGPTSSPTLAQFSATVFVAEVPTITTSAPVFTSDSPPLTATVGSSYSYTFMASGSPTPIYALASGAPAWLSIDSATGAVSGTPPTGTTSFTFSVTASNGVSPDATAGPFTVTLASLSGTARADVDLDTRSHDVKPGDTVTLHASVSGRHHKPSPTGTVSFTDNGTPISSCVDLVLPASGNVTCTLSYASTAGSPHQIVASYSGDATYEPGTATTTIRVTKIETHLRLDVSQDRVSVGQQLTYRATIFAGQDHGSPPPTGTVTFTDDGVLIAGCSGLALNTSGPTTCAVTATKGTHHIQAVYSGDNAYDGSSATLTETVKASGKR
jgi:hypothetical protein